MNTKQALKQAPKQAPKQALKSVNATIIARRYSFGRKIERYARKSGN